MATVSPVGYSGVEIADFKVSLSFPWQAEMHDGAALRSAVLRDTIGFWV